MKNGNPNVKKIDILLVEDREPDITVSLAALKKANICNGIHVVTNAAEVMDFLLKTGKFASQTALPPETLILLSLNLTGVHALDVLRKIKGDERTKALSVIMLISSQEERGVMESYKMGANACIVKPFDLPKFVEAVSNLRLGWLLISTEDLPSK